MLVRDHYVPVLTGKAGEFQALERLTGDVLPSLSPLIDMPPIPLPPPPKPGEEPQAPDPPEKRLGQLLRSVARQWGDERRVMVDLAAYDRYDIDGRHPAEWLFCRGGDEGLWLMASAATDSSARYREALVRSAGWLKGLCLRARVAPGQDPDETVKAVGALEASLPRSDPAHTVLMLDLSRIAEHGERDAAVVKAVGDHLKALADAGRDVHAIAGTSMPEPIARGGPTRVRRREWRLWQALATEPLARHAAFADYGITGPRPDDDAFRPGPAPHLRYTTSAALLLWRGRKGTDADPEDPERRAVLYPELCRELVDGRDRDFRGKSFSAGDAGIWDAACGQQKPGNATKWIEFATNHHLTQVVRQLQSQ
jgi:hypothetical protein